VLRARVIPCLLLREGGLVKTVRFRKAKYVGDPINAVRIFNEKEVDELAVFDIDCSRKNGIPDDALLEQIAGECFMPLCYGGGVSSLAQAQRLVALGIEKISVNSAVLEDISLVTRLADAMGSQSVVAAIDVKRDWLGRCRVYAAARGRVLELEPASHAASLQKAGAGEIFLNDVDRDGTLAGFDCQLVSTVSRAVDIPVIACGGAGTMHHFAEAVGAGAAAVAAGSMFVFQGPHRAVLINYPGYAELEQLLGRR
jgi:cyclase